MCSQKWEGPELHSRTAFILLGKFCSVPLVFSALGWVPPVLCLIHLFIRSSLLSVKTCQVCYWVLGMQG